MHRCLLPVSHLFLIKEAEREIVCFAESNAKIFLRLLLLMVSYLRNVNLAIAKDASGIYSA